MKVRQIRKRELDLNKIYRNATHLIHITNPKSKTRMYNQIANKPQEEDKMYSVKRKPIRAKMPDAMYCHYRGKIG